MSPPGLTQMHEGREEIELEVSFIISLTETEKGGCLTLLLLTMNNILSSCAMVRGDSYNVSLQFPIFSYFASVLCLCFSYTMNNTRNFINVARDLKVNTVFFFILRKRKFMCSFDF